MPSTSTARTALTLVVLACVCTSVAGATGRPAASSPATGCFPGVDSIDSGEAVGDVVELEMLLCFSGSVTVEGPGFVGTARLGDGNHSGTVTLGLNTHRNGAAAFSVSSSTLESVPMNASGNGSFEPGTYTVTVRGWSGDVVETLTFRLEEPRAKNLSVWRRPVGAAENLQTVESLRRARERAVLVDSQRQIDDVTDGYLPVAVNETVVIELRAAGLEGAMNASNGTPLARFRRAIQAVNASFEFVQALESVTTERQPLTPDLLNSSAVHLVADAENDTYYLVIDTQSLVVEREYGGTVDAGTRLGMVFLSRFSMRGAIREENPPSDLVAADYRVVEPAIGAARTDTEPVLFAPESDERLRVATTLAPGTTVTVRIAGAENRTVRRAVGETPDGPGFVVSLNLSGVPNGTTVTVTAERNGHSLGTVEGVVVSPTATLEVRKGAVAEDALTVYSLSVSHPSIVVVYGESGEVVGTGAIEPGASVGLSIPLEANATAPTMYCVAVLRDVDRSGSLTEPDEPYRDGGEVQETVGYRLHAGTPTPTPGTPTPTPATPTPDTPTEMSPGTGGSPEPREPTRTRVPGFDVVAGSLGLLLAVALVRKLTS